MLGAVYVDTKDEKRIVAVRLRASFKPTFQVATARERAEVILVHDSEGVYENADQPPPGGYGVEADLRFRGGDGGGSNYTVNTESKSCLRRDDWCRPTGDTDHPTGVVVRT